MEKKTSSIGNGVRIFIVNYDRVKMPSVNSSRRRAFGTVNGGTWHCNVVLCIRHRMRSVSWLRNAAKLQLQLQLWLCECKMPPFGRFLKHNCSQPSSSSINSNNSWFNGDKIFYFFFIHKNTYSYKNILRFQKKKNIYKLLKKITIDSMWTALHRSCWWFCLDWSGFLDRRGFNVEV